MATSRFSYLKKRAREKRKVQKILGINSKELQSKIRSFINASNEIGGYGDEFIILRRDKNVTIPNWMINRELGFKY